jgi:hypothetical protein
MLVAALVRVRLERVYARRLVTAPAPPARTAGQPAWIAPREPLFVNDGDGVDVRSDLEPTHR